MLSEEVGQCESDARSVLRVLQLLPNSQFDPLRSCDGRWPDGSRLDLARTTYCMRGIFMDWYKVSLDDGPPTFGSGPDIFIERVEEIFQENLCPSDFCVFQDHNGDGSGCFYFTPKAREYSESLFKEYRGPSSGPCEKPSDDGRVISWVVGNQVCQEYFP